MNACSIRNRSIRTSPIVAIPKGIDRCDYMGRVDISVWGERGGYIPKGTNRCDCTGEIYSSEGRY